VADETGIEPFRIPLQTTSVKAAISLKIRQRRSGVISL